jgi:hypothetical protein
MPSLSSSTRRATSPSPVVRGPSPPFKNDPCELPALLWPRRATTRWVLLYRGLGLRSFGKLQWRHHCVSAAPLPPLAGATESRLIWDERTWLDPKNTPSPFLSEPQIFKMMTHIDSGLLNHGPCPRSSVVPPVYSSMDIFHRFFFSKIILEILENPKT